MGRVLDCFQNCLVEGECLINGNGWGNFQKPAIGTPFLFGSKEKQYDR